jgi:hypothetical protein
MLNYGDGISITSKVNSTGYNRSLLIEPPFYGFYKDIYSLASLPLSFGYLAGAALNN